MNMQTALLDYIAQFKKEHHNRSPSYQEIVDAGICRSKATVHRHVSNLLRRGYLIRDGDHLEVASKAKRQPVSSTSPYSLPEA